MNLTDYIAIYGAILSSIAICWNIYNNLQDRPKVKIETSFGFMSHGADVSGHLFFVKAVNKGKSPVYLSSFGLRTNDGDLIPNRITGVPCELKGGTSHNEFFKVDELKNKHFDFAWYRDETGKIYKSKSITEKLNNYFKSEKIKKESVK